MNHMFSEYSKISSMYRVRTGSKQGAYLTIEQSYVFISSSCKAINIHYITPFGQAWVDGESMCTKMLQTVLSREFADFPCQTASF